MFRDGPGPNSPNSVGLGTHRKFKGFRGLTGLHMAPGHSYHGMSYLSNTEKYRKIESEGHTGAYMDRDANRG